MKYFIRRKNNINIEKKSLRSVFLITLAFAVFTSFQVIGAEKGELPKNENLDSVAPEFTARYFFEKTTIPALELLTPSMRLDMLDYWDADSVYKVSNVMEGLSWLETVTDSYLKVRITPVSELEIKILPYKKEKIAMTVYTVGSEPQASDSDLEFYKEDFQMIEEKNCFEIPELKDFFDIPKGSVTTMKEIKEMIPFPTVAYSASPDSDDLKGWLTVKEYINEDDWNIIKLFLKPSITLEWKKDKYKYKK